jgi:hypothetical protein
MLRELKLVGGVVADSVGREEHLVFIVPVGVEVLSYADSSSE